MPKEPFSARLEQGGGSYRKRDGNALPFLSADVEIVKDIVHELAFTPGHPIGARQS